jgi:Cu(I)/Ag(I) efflux system membrane fusion protein
MMRHTLTVLALFSLVFVGGAGSLEASDAMKAIVGSYLEIHAQLMADKIDGIKTSAGALASRAEGMGPSGAAMVKAAKAVGASADIKAARDAFGPLSDAVVAAAKAEGYKDLGDVKLAYCPMVQKSWLQKGDQIQNPYYGQAMSSCGEFKKK